MNTYLNSYSDLILHITTMEGRTRLPRKARYDSEQRKEHEVVESSMKKRAANTDTESVAPKAMKRAKSEDRNVGASKPKTNGKAVVQREAAGIGEKKTANGKAGKKIMPKRRSQSADSHIKKGRGNKTAVTKLSDAEEEDEKVTSKDSTTAPKKSRLKKPIKPKIQAKESDTKAVAKKAAKESEDDEDSELESPPRSDKVEKKGAISKFSDAEEEDEKVTSEDSNAAPKKVRGKKQVKSKVQVEPATKAVVKKVVAKKAGKESEDEDSDHESLPGSSKGEKKLLNDVATDYKKIDFSIKEKFNFKIATWNVAGVRALSTKNPEYFTQEDADIICMNVRTV